MTKWEVARYLIDAKKCVDSIWYIAENRKQIRNIDLRKKVSEILREFYINCCVVLDETHDKRALCRANPTIERIYYERDKDKAHKDANYKPNGFSSLLELRDRMKDQITTVFNNCSSVLPDNITLVFVPHDKELFRLAHSITPDIEERIKEMKYPHYNKGSHDSHDTQSVLRSIFHDTEDLRGIPVEKRNEYAVIFDAGINFFEMLQGVQDGCIKTNVIFNQNIWANIRQETMDWIIRLTKLGILDACSLPSKPDPNNKEAMKEYNRLMRGEIDFET